MHNQEFLQPILDHPHSIIVDDARSQKYSYQEFYTQVSRYAENLDQHNLKEKSIVIVYGYRNSYQALQQFYACLKQNLIPFIVEAGNLDKIKDLKFNAIITSEELSLEDYPKSAAHKKEDQILYTNLNEDVYEGNENDFLVVTSSGSTSKIPKKILLGKQQTLANIKSNQEALSITRLDTTLVMLPISYSYGLIAQFLSHIMVGANIVFANKSLGILQLPKLLQHYEVTNVFMTPLLSRLLLFYNKRLTTIQNNLRFMTIGGDKPQVEGLQKLQQVFQCPIYGTYGLAEAGPRVATNKFNLSTDLVLSLGDANPGISLQIEHQEKYQELCKAPKAGYLQIETPSLYLGYIQGNVLIPPVSNSILYTKDICVLENGKYQILGRDDEYIQHQNKTIWFYDIGKIFYKTPDVLKVKVGKDSQQRLDIKVYHRNKIEIEDFKKNIAAQYKLEDEKDYAIELIKFNNSQYK